MDSTGQVKKVRITATFEWTISNYSKLKEGYCYHSSFVEYFNMEWCLQIRKKWNGIDLVWLNRKQLTPGIPVPVHFSIQCKTADGEERGAVQEQKYSEHCHRWPLIIDPPWTIPFMEGFILTCSLHTSGVSREKQTEDTGLPGVSRETQTEDTGLPGISRETRTEDAGSRNDEHPSEDMEKLREKFRLWLQQPQEGGRIRILRREHFLKRPEGDPSSP